MKIINASAEILNPDFSDAKETEDILQRIELAGRTCYKSADHITPVSARNFAEKIVANHHEAMLEHACMTVRFIVDRGVSHELVRHRVASFAQESTRYCNYSKDKFGKEITVIKPVFFGNIPTHEIEDFYNERPVLRNVFEDKFPAAVHWYHSCLTAEAAYFNMLEEGCTPQEARSVLPNSLKTEVIMTANIREWRHFFRLRAACETGMPHPQMLEVAVPLLQQCREAMPELFSDIVVPDDVLKKYGVKNVAVDAEHAEVRDETDACGRMED